MQELVVELKTSAAPDIDINHLRGLARALAEFKAERLLYEHTQRAPAVESSYDRITDSDETEWRGIGVGATTQIIPPDKLTAAILEEIEPDTVQVDSTAFEISQTEDAAAESGFGDTLLAQPPQIPGSESYTQAIDYARTAAEPSNTDAVEPEGFEPDEAEPGTGESIKIETIGEDFLGDDFDDDFGDEVGFEAELPASIAAETSAAMEPEIETPAVTDEPEVEAQPVEQTMPKLCGLQTRKKSKKSGLAGSHGHRRRSGCRNPRARD